MITQYFFQDFSKLDHLEQFLKNHIESAVDRFIVDGRYKLTTRIRSIRAGSEIRRPKFLCEIRLDAPLSKTPIIIKKKSTNFYMAALKVTQSLKKILRRKSGKRAQHFRREYRKVVNKI